MCAMLARTVFPTVYQDAFLALLIIVVGVLCLPAEVSATGDGLIVGLSESSCSPIGTWDEATLTCTLSRDVEGHIIIQTPSVTLDGAGHSLTVDSPTASAVIRVDAEQVTIKNLTIHGGFTGIYFHQSNGGKALNNTFDSASDGIVFTDIVGGEATGNHFSYNSGTRGDVGIIANYSQDIVLRGNDISNTSYGISFASVTNSTIVGNTIDGTTGNGIDLLESTDIDVSGNTVSHSGRAAFSVDTTNAPHNTIHGNTFSDSVIGADVEQSIKPDPASADEDTVFYGNTFLRNKTAATTSPEIARVRFFNPLPEGGNTWDTYDEPSEGCVDNDADGFCDTPYTVDSASGLTDQYPHATVTTPPDPCATPGACVSNVLFLPGIEGSRLYGGLDCSGSAEEKLWEPLDSWLSVVLGAGDSKLHKLFLNENGKSACDDVYVKEGDILDTVGGSDFYKPLIDEMNSLKSGGTMKDWKPVAYDWRLSLDDLLANGAERDGKIYYEDATSTPYIEQTLRALAASSKTGKVTIIAHSNGGLVAKALLKKLDADAPGLVDKLILVAVPQTGAPEDVGALILGYNAGIYQYTIPIVSNAAAQALAQNSPMAYHLLPSSAYLDSIIDEPSHPVVHFAGSAYDKERTLYGNSIVTQNILDDFLRASSAHLNSQLIEYGNSVHSLLDSWTPPASIEVDQIAGWGNDTIAGIDFYTQESSLLAGPLAATPQAEYRPIFIEDGDGTVPVPSALAMSTNSPNVRRYWVNLHSYSNNHPARDHSDIFAVGELQTFISNLLSGTANSLPEFISTTQPSSQSINKKLIFYLHSPLTLELTDSSGNHTGPAADGSFDQQIPGSQYGQFGDVQYLIAPEGSQYTLTMQGQASGTFSLDMQESSGGAITNSSTIANVPTTASTLATLTISDGIDTASPLSVDENGDGADIITITPQANATVSYEPPAPATTPDATLTPTASHANGSISIPIIITPPPVAATTTMQLTATTTIATTTPLVKSVLAPKVSITIPSSKKRATLPAPTSTVPSIAQTASVYKASQQQGFSKLGAAVYNGVRSLWATLLRFF